MPVFDDGIEGDETFLVMELLEGESVAALQQRSGTPAFMSQEQARGRWDEVDERSDRWSAGATLFTMLSGQLVHTCDTFNEQLGRAMTTPARSLASAAPAAALLAP